MVRLIAAFSGVLIWTALAVYSADGFLWMRRQRTALAAAA